MNVASLELCKELYELSGWSKTHMLWHKSANPMRALSSWLPTTTEAYWSFVKENRGDEVLTIPAYDLGYLLRKLPPEDKKLGYLDLCQDGTNWMARYTKLSATMMHAKADTPEDAAAKLAIELFKQGMLK